MASAVQTLERSIKDIDAGLWVCGDLCHTSSDYSKPQKPKMMACAVGLISLHGGHTVTKTIAIKGKTFDVKYAVYPEDETTRNHKKAPKNVRQALEYLVLALPPALRNLEEFDELSYSTNYTNITRKNIGSLSTVVLSGIVVGYNDGEIACKDNPAKAARQWFGRALKLAQNDKAKADAVKAATATEAARELSFA
jgi:hypothetical protein